MLPRPALLSRPLRILRPHSPLLHTHRPIPPHVPSLTRSQSTSLSNMLDPTASLSISSITSSGIELSDGLLLRGPALIINGRALLWDPPKAGGSWTGWNKDVWKVFEVVVPRPEILLFGTGKSMILPPPSVRAHLNSLGIQLDLMDTRNACSTYNLLLEEGRRVAAALMPLGKHVPWSDIPK